MATRARESGGATADAPAAQRLKRTDTEVTDDTTGLEHIPHWLLHSRIFEFLTAVESRSFLRDGFNRDSYNAQLTLLGNVCREWRSLTEYRWWTTRSVNCTLKMETDPHNLYRYPHARHEIKLTSSHLSAAESADTTEGGNPVVTKSTVHVLESFLTRTYAWI